MHMKVTTTIFKKRVNEGFAIATFCKIMGYTRTMTMTLTISIFNNILHLISPRYSCLLSDELTCSPDCTWPRFARRGADCDYPAVCDDAAKVNLPLLGVTYSLLGNL